MRLSVALISLLLAVGACKKGDGDGDFAEMVRDNPGKAIPLLEKKAASNPGDYDTSYLLAQAYKAVGNTERAAAWIRSALGTEKGRNPEVTAALKGELLEALRSQIPARRKGKQKEFMEFLIETNKLERELGRKNVEAGKALFDIVKANIDRLIKEGKLADAIREIGALEAIYYEDKAKEDLKARVPQLAKDVFMKKTTALFESGFSKDYATEEVYDKDQKAFLVDGGGVIEVGAEGMPDPKSPTFARDVEELACGLKASIRLLDAILSPFANESPLGRKLTRVELGKFQELAKKRRKTKWMGEPYDAQKEYAAGAELSFACRDSLPLQTVVEAFHVLSLQPKPKPEDFLGEEVEPPAAPPTAPAPADGATVKDPAAPPTAAKAPPADAKAPAGDPPPAPRPTAAPKTPGTKHHIVRPKPKRVKGIGKAWAPK